MSFGDGDATVLPAPHLLLQPPGLPGMETLTQGGEVNIATTTGAVYPVHIRHDPNGEGPVCYEISGEPRQHLVRGGVERFIRDGFDVHSASACPHTGRPA